jgi:hypothetical protein
MGDEEDLPGKKETAFIRCSGAWSTTYPEPGLLSPGSYVTSPLLALLPRRSHPGGLRVPRTTKPGCYYHYCSGPRNAAAPALRSASKPSSTSSSGIVLKVFRCPAD